MTIKHNLSKFFPRKIWQQIFILLFFLIIFPLFLTGPFLINNAQNALQSTIKNDMFQIVQHASGEIVKEYEGNLKTLSTTASLIGTLQEDIWRQETALVEVTLHFPSLRRIASIDLNGREITSSQPGSKLNILQHDSIFLCASKGSECVSKVYLNKDHTPTIDIAVPILRLGKVIGVLRAEYSLRGIWDLLDSIKVDNLQDFILVDQEGLILSSKDKKQVLKNQQISFQKALTNIKMNLGGVQIEEVDKQAWIVAYYPIKNLGWGLCIIQPVKEAFKLIDVMNRNAWVLILLSILATGFVALLLANRMSRPIEELKEATKNLVRGDGRVLLPIKRNDEMGRLMFAFNRMSRELKKARHDEKLSIVGRSATAIAHELKNSLTLVKTFIQIMPERHKDKAFIKESTETILKELETWNGMLRNMMDFAKDPMPLRRSWVNFQDLIEDVTLLPKLRAEDLHLKFIIDIAPNLPPVELDKERIKQVLVNLINNAFEAVNKEGTIAVLVKVDRVNDVSYLNILISNSGEGITQEKLKMLFTPFYTTKEEGLGLGLSISRDIIYRHGGRLDVKSQPNQGAVFSIKLPVYLDSKQAERKEYDLLKNRHH